MLIAERSGILFQTDLSFLQTQTYKPRIYFLWAEISLGHQGVMLFSIVSGSCDGILKEKFQYSLRTLCYFHAHVIQQNTLKVASSYKQKTSYLQASSAEL